MIAALRKRASDFDDRDAHCDIVNWLMKDHPRFRFNNKIIGIAMVAVGAIIIFNSLIPYVLYAFDIERYWVIMRILRTLLLALCFIAGGIWLAFRKPQKHKYIGEGKDDLC